MRLHTLTLLAFLGAAKAVYPHSEDFYYPPIGNLLIGREARLSASSTCGQYHRERYSIDFPFVKHKQYLWCDSTAATRHQPNFNHRVQNIIDEYYPGTRMDKWWQSENGKENVTIQLDMEAEFYFTELIVKFKTFKPAAMLVERSFDFGKTWRVDRYFASDCSKSFPGVPTYQSSPTDVVCECSAKEPITDNEVKLQIVPQNVYKDGDFNTNTVEVQNLSRMTNLRLNFTKFNSYGDESLDNRAHEKYYYAIYQMIVRGSCSCNGHSSRCLPMPGMEYNRNMVNGRCECTHNTKGINCESCEDFYNDLPWQPAVACKRCKCNNHARSCHFDDAVYNETGGITGGVCDNCEDNTAGLNCERCIPQYYRDPTVNIESPEVCKPI